MKKTFRTAMITTVFAVAVPAWADAATLGDACLNALVAQMT